MLFRSVRAVRSDGSIIETPVVIQGATGEIQIDEKVAAQRTSDAAPLNKMMALARSKATTEAARLAAAFHGHA